MVLVRLIFQAKFGKAGEVANQFKAGTRQIGEMYGGRSRVLTDLSGQFDTVVLEIEVENLAHLEKIIRATRRVKGITDVARRERLTDG